MGEWYIYGVNGSVKATVKKLEYSGEFMGETSVTCDVYSPSPISFSTGDYLVYRGEMFTIDYDATRLKQARNNTYGKGYTYENMRFLSYVGELKKCDFLDFVPSDNQIPFSQSPEFSFFAEDVSDLADRLQANLDRIYTGGKAWTVQVASGFEGKKNIEVIINRLKIYDGLKIAYDQFDATFIIRGRTITIGTAGNELVTDFKYGKGNGLKTIERSVDDSDAIVTRLRAYGNTTNMPANYYRNLGMEVYFPIREVYYVSQFGCDIHFNKFSPKCFYDPASAARENYRVNVSLDKSLWLAALASPNENKDNVDFSVVSVQKISGNTQEMLDAFISQLQSGMYSNLYFRGAINYGAWPLEYRVYAEDMPDFMSIDRLMLPGFPELTTDPYIDSSNIDVLGIREKSVFFDGSSNETPDVYPTIEGMTAAELRAAGYDIDLDSGDNGNLDEIAVDATELDGSPITADGSFEDVDEVPGFKVTIKDVGFNIKDYLSQDAATLVMKSGMCGAREFTIVDVQKVGNKYVLECQRTEDSGISKYYPYNQYPIKAGDKFVLTNLEMPKVYIDAASQRLLAVAQEYIAKYSVPQWVYSIKMDDIWMQRQRDNSVSEASSYYWNIKEGDVMHVVDTDLDIDIAEVIDRLTIREGFGPIPEFEVVLRKEKPQGTIGALQNRIRQLELRNAQQVSTIYRQQNYIDLIVGDRLNTIQEQVDNAQVTYFYEGVPTLSNYPASEWDVASYPDHVHDMYYDKTTGKAYEFDISGSTYAWSLIQDEDIVRALADASTAQDTADGKRRVFVTAAGTLPTPPYDAGDMWVNATYPSNSTATNTSGNNPLNYTYYNDILKCVTPREEGDATANIGDWRLASKYTDDSSLNAFLNGYTGTLTGIRNDITNAATAASNAQTSANNANTAAAAAKAAADALDYLKQAYLADNTLIDHGLILSTIVALRDSSNNVWSGISGAYDSTKLGNGIAAWYGGGMIDKEVSADSNAAKSLFRFDGSGYVASGNLKWDANGNVTIQGYSINASTLQVGGVNVATESSISTFFANFFDIYNGSTQITYAQYIALQDKSNVSIKAKYGLWTEQYLSALGLNSQGGGGTGDVSHIKIGTNPDVYLDPVDGIIDMSSYAANWNDAYNKRHTHSNKSVLDGITSTKVSHWDAVYGVVPSAAYESGNQLADKNFVNSSISTATATFRGTVTASDDTDAAAATALATISTKDLNDYAFVKVENTPQTGVDKYKRYKYNGTSWIYEFTLNNSSFTSDQWNAINSGITPSLVTKLNGIAAGAQVNVIESVKVNGTELSISSKAVDILTGNGLQSSTNTISIKLDTNSGLSVSSSGLKLDAVNALNSTLTYKALSAAQGKALNDRLAILEAMFTREGAGTAASPYVIKANYGLYTNQFLSSLGQNSQGGSGDFSEEQMWAALGTDVETKVIDSSHIPDTSSLYGYLKASSLNGYATQNWVNSRGFLTSQNIYALTLKANGTDVTTYTPNNAAASLNLVAGTNISLTKGTNAITIANTYSYTLPLAASGTRGGVRIGYEESGKNYAVKLSSEKMYVNVPWTDTTYTIATGDANGQIKVTPSSGNAYNVSVKGLGSNAYTSTAYLPLAGGTVASSNFGAFNVQLNDTTNAAAIGFKHYSSGTTVEAMGYIGMNARNGELKRWNATADTIYTILDSNNYNNYAPKKDGTGASGTWGIGISGNAATSTTLQTSRTIWGQSFNGSANVSGDMSSVGNISFSASGKNIGGLLYFDTTNSRIGVGTSSPGVKFHIEGQLRTNGLDTSTDTFGTYIEGRDTKGLRIQVNGTGGYASIKLKDKKVGINFLTDDPTYNLHVNGTFYASRNSSIGGTLGVTGATTLTGLLTANGNIVTGTSNGAYIQIGAIKLVYDSTNNALKVIKSDNTSANFYATGAVSALGANSSGGGGGDFDEEQMWAALRSNTGTFANEKIDTNHIPDMAGIYGYLKQSALSGYVTSVKVGTTAYNPSSGVVSLPAYPTTLPASDVYAWAKASTKPSYTLDEVSDGSTRKLANYLPLAGGTMTGDITVPHIHINDTGGANSLTFVRGNYSYIRAKTIGGKLGFITDGKDMTGNSVDFAIGNGWVSVNNGVSGASGYNLYVNGSSNATTLYENGSRVITSGNIGSQSVSYATSAGSVAWANVSGHPTNVSAFTNDRGYITSEGSCKSATYITSPYAGCGRGGTILDSTTSDVMAKSHNGTLYPVFHNTDWGWSDTLYWSGYAHYGGTELATLYNAGSNVRVKIRKYNQSVNGWGEWTEFITSGNIGSQSVSYATYAGSCIGNAATATQLQTSRTLWGRSFNGTANVSGDMTGVGSIDASGWITITTTGTSTARFIAKNDNGAISLYRGNNNAGVYHETLEDWLIYTNGTNTIMKIGNVGIGTTSPSYKLDVNGTFNASGNASIGGTATIGSHVYMGFGKILYMQNSESTNQEILAINTNDNLRIGYGIRSGAASVLLYSGSGGVVFRTAGSNTTTASIDASGNFITAGENTASSDARKKNIISDTKFNVRDIASARSILYEWNDGRDKYNDKKVHGGSIAQDWLGKADSFLNQDSDGWYSINYGALALCSAITIAREVLKHSDEIDRLKQEISYLKAKIAELEERRAA